MSGFNKWFPDRPPVAPRNASLEKRAWLLRGAWYVSTLMLIVGYVLLFAFWNAP